MENLIKYRMENLDWIDDYLAKLGADAFLDFERRVYNALERLNTGRYYDIAGSIIPEQQELFVKFCCCYISNHPEYEFNDDYTQIWRKESYEQWKMAIPRRQFRKG
ncbi:hypothetical protein [uncultured Bacteroides sp.]|uniref:hypothetical protein n=1 Tax=uncultured Bacteroides sp. TaxID=162156 RepID=UPI0025F9AA31|nr:hypothetical protein [uncultured Bacteroides sp.]